MENRDVLIFLHSLFLNEKLMEELLRFDELDKILHLSKEELIERTGAKFAQVEKIITARNKDYFNKLISDINKYATQVFTIYDDDYPEELRYIEEPPLVLYAKGLKLNLEGVRIGVVGSRKATAYGKFATEKFVSELADMGVTIVSGMAQGIDALSHRVAMDNSTYTIGVLGTGIDTKFPATNSALYDRIYENGTVISEYPIGAAAMPHNFPRRNRIISGLSQGVIVVEAKDKSGSLITARLAAEQGKEVFAVPGNINSLYSEGTNKLIRDGAIPLLDVKDIVDNIFELQLLEAEEKNKTFEDLSDEELEIVNIIIEGTTSLDGIINLTGIEITKLSSILTMLEMKGVVEEMSGMGFVVKK